MMYNVCNRHPLVCVSRLMVALQLYIIQQRVSLVCAKFRICSFIGYKLELLCYDKCGSAKPQIKAQEVQIMDVNSLAHTKWECKYHIVFAPKYRRQIIYKQIRADVGEILGSLCRRKGIEIIEAECCPDHIHMLVRIPPKYSVAEIVGYLKGKSSLMIFERHANLKYKYGNRHFWCRGYYVDTVGKNIAKIKEYIQNQLKEDL